MEIAKKISEIREAVKAMKKQDVTIGFVPTMGYLHKGHLSLVKHSLAECCKTVVSIFVNPTQFGPSEDYDRYPRDPVRDAELLKKEGVDLLFMPSVEEMYGKDFFTSVEVSSLAEKLEGSLRPGHFRGVCTVVCKLFNIVTPDNAYFGWKDAQQLVIIQKMVNDLNIPVKVKGCPTVRESDGLAASSRNIYISADKRKNAVALYKGLSKIKDMVENMGITATDVLLTEGRESIERFSGVELQYLEIVEMDNLNPIKKVEDRALILGAIKVSGVRLIDNMMVEMKRVTSQ